MSQNKNRVRGFVAAAGMLLLILDTETAIMGVSEGIRLCQYTLIPSLFPFFILSTIIGSSLNGFRMPGLRFLCKLLKIPDGGESLLLLGFAGGYPVGAQCIAQGYDAGFLKASDAKRMLGFCNNAGPAFIFGITSSLFQSKMVPWALWGIHIGSALLTALLLPTQSVGKCKIRGSHTVSLTEALEKSIQTMAKVCGFVILFRVILAFLNKWFMQLLHPELQVLVTGTLELANGFTSLHIIPQEGTRFILCAFLLALGGLCVGMQTISVTKKLGTGMYLHGKLLQCIFSTCFAIIMQYFLFPKHQRWEISVYIGAGCLILPLCILIFLYAMKKCKKTVAIVR